MPDGDLFRAIRHGRASVVTGTIETVHRDAASGSTTGEELEADLVVTATGLNLKPFGGVDLVVDGEKVDAADSMAYKALMLSGIPNFAYTLGYSNASWTLKADLVTDYVCRLLAHMDEHGHRRVVAEPDPTCRPSRSSRSGPATCCARRTCCRSRATATRGGCARTTSTTCAPSASTRSTTGCSPSRDPDARTAVMQRIHRLTP